VRQLREELLAARRDRAVGEAREAELRRKLSNLKRQVRVSCLFAVVLPCERLHNAPMPNEWVCLFLSRFLCSLEHN
jgi:hypothetical protein